VSRTELEARLAREGLTASVWENGPGERYPAHDHGYDKVLVVAAGGIRFGLPDAGRNVDLAVGDRLDLPAGTTHDAIVGPSGVTCLEAHAPRGTLAAPARRAAGTW
jgi:quercetin dioxygenase-like cupin family protein